MSLRVPQLIDSLTNEEIERSQNAQSCDLNEEDAQRQTRWGRSAVRRVGTKALKTPESGYILKKMRGFGRGQTLNMVLNCSPALEILRAQAVEA